MIRFVIKRILSVIPVLIGVTFVVFCITHFTPGDPVLSLLGSDVTQEAYDAMYIELGLDQPFLIQYFRYLWGIITRFDLGTSYMYMLPVRDLILERFHITFLIVVFGVLLAVVIGIIAGIISAVKQYSVIDYVVTVFATLFTAVPTFWLAIMAVLVFALYLGLLPASGIDSLACWVLPVACCCCMPLANVLRQTRSSMLEVIRQDYIRTARAKGLAEVDIIRKHALRNALIPVVTVVGMQIGVLMGGASMVMETIFSIPGLGTLTLGAIQQNDYPVIQGCTLFLSFVCCAMNILVDIAYGFIDPRIMSQYKSSAAKKKKKSSAEQAVA